nr:solute carrier organic anion transporter family member 4A1-like [Lepeophtheirus salmonis]
MTSSGIEDHHHPNTFIPWEINSTKSGKGYSDVLCHSGEEEESLVNTTFSNLLPGSFESEFIDLSLYKYVFLLGQLLHGIGSAALITLGTTLLDGSVKKSSVPLYIGILNACFVIGPAFGFLVGGQFLNVFTEFYLVSVEHLNIDTASPKWVGAWWIGFLLIVVMSYLCAFLIGLYPARIPGCEESEVNKLASESSSISDEFVVNTCDFGKISELPRAILYLLSNATYACISLGATMDGFLLAALAAFMPKYMESQFGLTPGYAAILIGILIVPAGAGGSLLGGFIVKFYEFTRTQSIAMYIVCQLAILPLYLGFLLYCPNPPFAGVNSAYPHVPYNEQLSLSAGCNTNCSANCDVLSYMPVCGENGVSYFNPCYAGCKSNGTNGILRDCLCIDGPESIALEGCVHPIVIIFHFQPFSSSKYFLHSWPPCLALYPKISVEPLYRSLSLGLQTILVRGFGTVPGPIIFGLILDKSCLLWNDRDSGNCLLYDNYWSSRLIFGVLIIWRLVGAIFFIFAYFQSKKSKLADS